MNEADCELPSPEVATVSLVICDAIGGLLGAEGELPMRLYTDQQNMRLRFRIKRTVRALEADKLQMLSADFLPIVQKVVERTIREGHDV